MGLKKFKVVFFAPANFWIQTLQTERELQSQCVQLETLKRWKVFQIDIVELEQKVGRCWKMSERVAKEALKKLDADCEALRSNLNAETAINAI